MFLLFPLHIHLFFLTEYLFRFFKEISLIWIEISIIGLKFYKIKFKLKISVFYILIIKDIQINQLVRQIARILYKNKKI